MAESYFDSFHGLVQRLSRHKILLIVVVIAVFTGLFVWRNYAARSGGDGYLTAAAAYGNIASTVSANGNVEAMNEVTLTFENQGFVQADYVGQGDLVKTGQVLGQENQSDFQAQYESAVAALQNVQTNYQKLVATPNWSSRPGRSWPRTKATSVWPKPLWGRINPFSRLAPSASRL